MALKLKKKLDNGVTVNYHKIARIEYQYDNKQEVIEVASYTAEDKRDAEKAYFDNSKKQIVLQDEINQIFADAAEKKQEELTEEQQVEVNKKQEELNNIVSSYAMNVANVSYVTFPSDEPIIDMAELYNKIKEHEHFLKAEDLI